ncbi:glycosyltransferase family 87 protein [Hymenobacter saemangeumensis]|uniref:Glycosyltransferase family 87 protein n=1 Tax=Hymenobacter saemangeumensis TaxID=1084522 RepID=A0ABP8IMA9_9BACT
MGILYALLTVLISAQHFLKGPDSYNNYYIFVKPFFNLLAEKNLYLEYPEQYQDTYKYSPTFALFMGPLAVLPDWLGLFLWNAVNTAVFYFASLRLFPAAPRRQALFLVLVLIDSLTALHNAQANCLLAGLMVWTYIHLENRRAAWAGLCLALAAFIKVYGVGVGLLFLFYPGFWRNALWAAFWLLVLALAPLLVLSWPAFLMIYQGWYDIVRASATGIQLSLLGVLQSWFGFPLQYKGLVQALGLAVLVLPALYRRAWAEADFRRIYLASILIFVVIFNQMAESPTFIIAVTGFMLWFMDYRHTTPLAWPLFGLVLVFTTLSATDLTPHSIREAYFDVYKLKAVPMILAWLVIQSQLLTYLQRGHTYRSPQARLQEQA